MARPSGDDPQTGMTGLAGRLRQGIALLGRRGLARNGLFSHVQNLVLIVTIFAAYRLLIAEEGLASLGLWSLLMAFAGLAAAFDISGASALARFVARQNLDFAEQPPEAVVHTVLLTSFAVNLALGLLLLGIAQWALPAAIAPEQQGDALQLLPWAVGIFMLMPLANGLAAAIDGMLRADLRALLMSSAALAGLGVALVLIPRWGAVGLAAAQFTQQVIMVLGSWAVLRRLIPSLGWFPYRWTRGIFRLTTGYAVRLNVIGIISISLEPLTKYALNAVGGTAAVGVYELAARLTMQLRNLVVSSMMPLLPVLAAAADPADPATARSLRLAQLYATAAAAGVTLLALLAAAPMSWLIVGDISAEVLRMTALLAVGWGVNLFALPLYLLAQGQGLLRWNMLSHAVIGLAVAGAWWALAPWLGSEAVVLGVAAGLALGALLTIIGNGRAFALLPHVRASALLLCGAATGMVICAGLFWAAIPYLAG